MARERSPRRITIGIALNRKVVRENEFHEVLRVRVISMYMG
jgi:hypothetical protein